MLRSPSARRSGVALVLVLSFLALITIIVTAFFFSVKAQVAISESVSSSAVTEQLADSAVNLVMAQIRDATKGYDGTSILAWTSQPGMIRTFNSSNRPVNYYKLYSSDKMVVGGVPGSGQPAYDPLSDLPAADWNRDLFTDLNAPGVDATGKLVFPILDPAADGLGSRNRPITNPPYSVDGFSITAKDVHSYRPGADEGPNNNRAPMPVKWLYQLKDGTLLAPAAGTDSTISIPGATADNPITGRLAFWADDEGGKININTASEGTYWDIPRVWSYEDFGSMKGPNTVGTMGLSVCQPARNEFQRYPGHPATTCLSPVFGKLPALPGLSFKVPYPYPSPPSANIYGPYENYYNLAPRIGLASAGGGGGSLGGTKLYIDSGNLGLHPLKSERLYASVDELMFSSLSATGGRVPNTATGSSTAPGKITKDFLQKAQFFLTANSSAPETTLFNTPRVSIWPVWLDKNIRTAYDSLSAFCSTINPIDASGNTGGQFYFFTRANSRSQTADLSPRNVELMSYLKRLTSTPIPGYGGTFQAKYPAPTGAGPLSAKSPSIGVSVTECDQILTEIYDYIRCTNLQDKSFGAKAFTSAYELGQPGAGEVLPIRMRDGTQGFGRYYSFTQAIVHFYCTFPVTEILPSTTPKTYLPAKMKAIFYILPSTPAQGLGPIRSNLFYRVSGLQNLQIQFDGADQPVSLNFPSTGVNYIDNTDISILHGRGIGGSETANLTLINSGGGSKAMSPGSSSRNNYPFVSTSDIVIPPVTTVPPDAKKRRFFRFVGSTQNIVVEVGDAGASGSVIQRVSLKLPPAPKLRVPGALPAAGVFGVRDVKGNSYNIIDGGAVKTYAPFVPENPATPDDTGTDTVIGLQVAGTPPFDGSDLSPSPGLDSTAGDFRMTSTLFDVPPQRYRADNNWVNTGTGGTAYAHGLLLTIGDYLHGGTYGKLANVADQTPAAGYPTHGYYQTGSGTARQPDVPSRAKSGVFRVDGGPGDWDSGWGDQKDGPHINKPDEGDSKFDDTQGSGYRSPYSLGYGQGYAAGTNSYFSPTRMVPSPMMFGSLPTGVLRMRPWQTLSFAPRPEDRNHPGNVSPRDHLLADLFWMPVVEPYAISQPFATSGKINLNYRIMPFSYINRQTGLLAVLKSTKFAAIPLSDASLYKPLDGSSNGSPRVLGIRQPLDLTETLKDVAAHVNTPNSVFKSATEICEINLVPQGSAYTDMRDYWPQYKLTGDNLREKPYVDLYPRLTTKSNTFTVHVRVQSLRKAKNTPPDQWVSGRDSVLGEYRGSSILERYVDLNDPKNPLPDFATAFTGNPSTSPNLDTYYKMRIVSTKRFAP